MKLLTHCLNIASVTHPFKRFGNTPDKKSLDEVLRFIGIEGDEATNIRDMHTLVQQGKDAIERGDLPKAKSINSMLISKQVAVKDGFKRPPLD